MVKVLKKDTYKDNYNDYSCISVSNNVGSFCCKYLSSLKQDGFWLLGFYHSSVYQKKSIWKWFKWNFNNYF